MTLILTVCGAPGVIQVGERLASIGEQPHDPLWNKTVVCVAPDAAVSMGYTGLGEIEGQRTDDWIAERILDEAVADLGTMRIGLHRKFRRLDKILFKIGEELERAFALPRASSSPQAVAVAGWQWNRHGLARPVFYRVTNRGSGSRFWIERGLRRWGWEQGRVFHDCTPDLRRELPQGFLHDLFASDSLEAAQDVMVAAVRSVADGRPGTVGRDCVGVVMPTPRDRRITVTYLPEGTRLARLEMSQRTVDLPAAFSPWILTPTFVQRPSVFTGSWQAQDSSGWTIEVCAPDVPEGGYQVLGRMR